MFRLQAYRILQSLRFKAVIVIPFLVLFSSGVVVRQKEGARIGRDRILFN